MSKHLIALRILGVHQVHLRLLHTALVLHSHCTVTFVPTFEMVHLLLSMTLLLWRVMQDLKLAFGMVDVRRSHDYVVHFGVRVGLFELCTLSLTNVLVHILSVLVGKHRSWSSIHVILGRHIVGLSVGCHLSRLHLLSTSLHGQSTA